MSDERRGLGRAIFHGIIRESLVRAECEGLCVWSANADEMLEAILEDFAQNAVECRTCGNYALLGEHDPAGFTCCDCLPASDEA